MLNLFCLNNNEMVVVMQVQIQGLTVVLYLAQSMIYNCFWNVKQRFELIKRLSIISAWEHSRWNCISQSYSLLLYLYEVHIQYQ